MNSKIVRLSVLLCLLSAARLTADGPLPPAEQQVSDAIRSPGTTVVHLWATWCPNCRAELASEGWRRIIEANPGTHFIFVTVWSDTDGSSILARFGIGSQKNFTLISHPNHSHVKADRMSSFLGQPVSWIPATQVYKAGEMHYALDYGEMHFPILQQFIDDCSNSWDRPPLAR